MPTLHHFITRRDKQVIEDRLCARFFRATTAVVYLLIFRFAPLSDCHAVIAAESAEITPAIAVKLISENSEVPLRSA